MEAIGHAGTCLGRQKSISRPIRCKHHIVLVWVGHPTPQESCPTRAWCWLQRGETPTNFWTRCNLFLWKLETSWSLPPVLIFCSLKVFHSEKIYKLNEDMVRTLIILLLTGGWYHAVIQWYWYWNIIEKCWLLICTWVLVHQYYELICSTW